MASGRAGAASPAGAAALGGADLVGVVEGLEAAGLAGAVVGGRDAPAGQGVSGAVGGGGADQVGDSGGGDQVAGRGRGGGDDGVQVDAVDRAADVGVDGGVGWGPRSSSPSRAKPRGRTAATASR